RGAAHGPAGAVAGRAEGLFHAPRLAYQDPARPAHVPGDDDRLADLGIEPGNLGMLRRKGARGALAVHPDLLRLGADPVLFELGDVVAHVIDQAHVHGLPGLAEDLGEYFPRLLHQELAIAPGEVG